MQTLLHEADPVLVEVPMPIVTPRLILRPFQAGDGQELADTIKSSWPELNAWMPWAADDTWESNTDPQQREILCRNQYAKFILREDLMMRVGDRETGRMVASTGLHRMDWRTRMFEIGYWVRSDRTGQGYATEITNALVRYALTQLSANRVYIAHDPENLASRRVIEKLGFVKEGETRMDELLGGRWRGTCHYARYDLNGLPELNVNWGDENE